MKSTILQDSENWLKMQNKQEPKINPDSATFIDLGTFYPC